VAYDSTPLRLRSGRTHGSNPAKHGPGGFQLIRCANGPIPGVRYAKSLGWGRNPSDECKPVAINDNQLAVIPQRNAQPGLRQCTMLLKNDDKPGVQANVRRGYDWRINRETQCNQARDGTTRYFSAVWPERRNASTKPGASQAIPGFERYILRRIVRLASHRSTG